MRHLFRLVFLTVLPLAGCYGGAWLEAGRSDLPLIVKLRSRDHLIFVYSSPTGPLYSVMDLRGETLAEGGSPEEIQSTHPELYPSVRELLAGIEADDRELWAGRDLGVSREGPDAGAPVALPR
ncbi:MAG: hypothetical protein O7J95_05650 [Planctomycetota bacterium]|nr:hypothetical protein [Planctomycetota bacterium]